MKYSAKDIEVFVTTYNRADFLDQTLKSLLAQTEKGFRLVVLDNGSDDHTPDVLNRYKEHGIEIIRNCKNEGSKVNFYKARELACRNWTIVFHDDDLLHPAYLRNVLKILNTHNDVVLVGSSSVCDRNPKPIWRDLRGKMRKFENVSDFAAFLLNGFGFHYASAVYRTDLFKGVPQRDDMYGKIADRPFLFDIAAYGSVAVFTEPYIKYRLHPGQDIMTNKNGPFANELIALRKKYYDLLGDNIFSRNSRIFLANTYRLMRSEASRMKDIDFKEYLKMTIDGGALSRRALVLGKIMFPLIHIRDQHRRIVRKMAAYYNSLCIGG